MQLQKTALLKKTSIAETTKKFYTNKTNFFNFINKKRKIYNQLQHVLKIKRYFIHNSLIYQLFADINFNKKNRYERNDLSCDLYGKTRKIFFQKTRRIHNVFKPVIDFNKNPILIC